MSASLAAMLLLAKAMCQVAVQGRCRAIGTLHRLGGTMEIFVGKERNLLFGSTSKSLKMTKAM